MLSFNSPAKLNIFLKIVGKENGYHLLNSRFVRFEDLSDRLTFIEKEDKKSGFEICGNFNCKLEDNTIFKAYKNLLDYTKSKKIDEFLSTYSLCVEKNIPTGAGLGGGSSNAATFILALNEILELKLKREELFFIGKKVGADVNFFLSEFRSANVSGIGDKVEGFEDDEAKFVLNLIDIHADTTKVYKTYSENFADKFDANLAKEFMKTPTHKLLKDFDASKLNDLLKPLLICYPDIKKFYKKDEFLSGSGSTFFKVKNG